MQLFSDDASIKNQHINLGENSIYMKILTFKKGNY